MDSRLNLVGRPPQRPKILRRDDLPRLTRALIAVVRKRGAAYTATCAGVDYVVLNWPEGDMHVLKTDWDKIDPLILEGVMDPTAIPVRQAAVYLYPPVAFGEPVLDWADRAMYFYLIGKLKLIFTEQFPTSDL